MANDSPEMKHILACLGEEAGEVQELTGAYLMAVLGKQCGHLQHGVGKSLRFGIDDSHPHTGKQNWESLQAEVHDIVAVYEMICRLKDTNPYIDPRKLTLKQLKVNKYMLEYGIPVGEENDN